MPIRLADIPNVPSAGNPSLDGGGAMMPSVPRGAYLDGASLSRAAANLREGPVDSSAVNAGVNAMQNFGAAVRQAAGVPADLSQRMQKAQNVADIARADVIMRDAWGQHQDKMATLPPSQWADEWKNKGLPAVQDQLAKLNLSKAAQDQLAPDFIQWQGVTSTQVRTQALKQNITNNRQAVLNAADRAVLDEDYPLAIAHLKQGAATQLFSPAEADAHIVDIEAKVKAKAKLQQSDKIVAGIESDPWTIKPKLEAAARGESVPELGPLDATKAARLLSMAETAVRTKTMELRNDLRDKVLTGEIDEPAKLEAAAGGKLSKAVLLSLQGIMGKEIAFDPEKVTKIRTAIANYDPENDKGMGEYNALMSAIETGVPQKRQGLLASELNKVWTDANKEGRSAKVAFSASLMSEVDSMADRGILGQWKTGTGQKAVIDEAKKREVWVKAEGYKQDMRSWFSENPEATPAQAMDHFKGLFDSDAQKASAEQFKEQTKKVTASRWWNKSLIENMSGDDFGAGLSGELVKTVKNLEGFKENAYWDSGQTSIGYGTRGKPGEKISQAEADTRLRDELAKSAFRVDNAAKVNGVALTKNQRDALISFDFNTGAAPKVMESKTPDAIAKRMALYQHSDAKAQDGQLIPRRQKEISLFNKL